MLFACWKLMSITTHGLRLVLTCHLRIESLFSVGWPPPVPCGVDIPWGVQGASLFCQIHSNGFLDGEANCCHGEPWAKALGYLCLMGWDKIGEIRAFVGCILVNSGGIASAKGGWIKTVWQVLSPVFSFQHDSCEMVASSWKLATELWVFLHRRNLVAIRSWLSFLRWQPVIGLLTSDC